MKNNNEEEDEEIELKVTHAIKEFYEKRDYTKCISFSKRLLGKCSRVDQILLLTISNCYHFTNNQTKALKYLNKCLKNGKANFINAFNNAISLLAPNLQASIITKDVYLAVVKCFQAIIEDNPQCVETRLKFASFYQRVGNVDDALYQYRCVLEMNSKIISVWYNMSCLYLLKEDFMNLGKTYLEIALLFKEKISEEPNFSCYSEDDVDSNINKCIKYFIEAHKLLPDEVKIPLNLAEIHRMIDRHKEALGYVELAIKLQKKNPQAYYEGALIYDEIGDAHTAKEMIKICLTIDMSFIKAYNFFGNLLRKEKLYDSALKIFEAGLMRDPENVLLLNNFGNCYLEMGDKEKAKEIYLQAYHINKGLYEVNCNLATIFRKERNFERAIFHALEARKIQPNDPQLYNIEASIYKDAEMYDVAISSCNKALQLDHEDNTALYILSQCFKTIKRYEKAKEAILRVIASKPKFTDAFLIYLECLLCSNDWEKIEKNRPNLELLFNCLNITNNNISNILVDYLVTNVETKMKISDIIIDKEVIAARNFAPDSDYTFTYKKNFKSFGYLAYELTPQIYSTLCNLIKSHKIPSTVFIYNSSSSEDMNYFYNLSFVNLTQFKTQWEKARRINEEGVDVLIYLENLTDFVYENQNYGSVYQMLSFRPSTVQVVATYNGCSRGGKIFDYTLMDKYMTTNCSRCYYKEKCIYLESSYFFLSSYHIEGDDIETNNISLIEEPFIGSKFKFANFSENFKIDKDIFLCWMRILKEIKHSVLLLKFSTEEISNTLRSYAQSLHVNPQRIIFLEIKSNRDLYNLINQIDLYLDVQTLNGGDVIKTCIQLEKTIISIKSKDYPITSHITSSLLSNLKLKRGVIADSLPTYEKYAIKLAQGVNYFDACSTNETDSTLENRSIRNYRRETKPSRSSSKSIQSFAQNIEAAVYKIKKLVDEKGTLVDIML